MENYNNKMEVTELAEMSQEEKMKLMVSGVSEADLPAIIEGRVDELAKLDKSIQESMKKAEKAVDSAKSAKRQSAGLFQKRVAIEELQSAGVDLADAVVAGAEAQKISFEFQRKLAEISKYLFGLGVSNIANNRFVVRELELRLKGASKEKLSTLAKQELMTVVKQLKDQEDILIKQQRIMTVVKSHDEKLAEHTKKSDIIEKLIVAQDEVDKKHEEELKKQSETDRKLEELIRAQDEVDKNLAEQVAAQEETDKRLEKLIRAQDEVDKNLAEQVAAQEDTDRRLEKLIKEQNSQIVLLETELKELKLMVANGPNKSLVIITLFIAVISLIASVIGLMI